MWAVSKIGKPSSTSSPDTGGGSASGKWQFLGKAVRTGAWVSIALPNTAWEGFPFTPHIQSPPPAKDVGVCMQVSALLPAVDTHCSRLQQWHLAATTAITAAEILAPGKHVTLFWIFSHFPCYVTDWIHTSTVLGLVMGRRVQAGKKDISMRARQS